MGFIPKKREKPCRVATPWQCSRSPREADEQLRHYVTEIAKKQPVAPFGFMANGHDIWFWEVGLANPRLGAGFFTPADLERLRFLRQNRLPLEATAINNSIVDRPDTQSRESGGPIRAAKPAAAVKK